MRKVGGQLCETVWGRCVAEEKIDVGVGPLRQGVSDPRRGGGASIARYSGTVLLVESDGVVEQLSEVLASQGLGCAIVPLRRTAALSR